MALLLWKAGLRRVRPLEGGIEEWRSLGYPLEPVVATELEDEPGYLTPGGARRHVFHHTIVP